MCGETTGKHQQIFPLEEHIYHKVWTHSGIFSRTGAGREGGNGAAQGTLSNRSATAEDSW